jgi:DNA (cytosine-5)-methyltransferase 1
MRYLSVCSGIEAATVAWRTLGWSAAAFSEIEPFPCAVLDYHYPGVANLGDMMRLNADAIGSIDILVGGTPCQSFSIACLRKGLDDPRGQLVFGFLRLVDEMRPAWVLWENVPGVRSSGRGRDFGAFLGALGKLGYGWAYRSLDAQYFDLAQRRERVFVVGHLGDWRRAGAVLLERASLSGNPPPRRETRAHVADLTANGVGTCGGDDSQAQAGHLISHALNGGVNRFDGESETFVTPTLRALAVRRLTPRECERLQGFPDDYTLVPYRGKLRQQCPDSPRYRALGNSMAVPVMRWIGKRMAEVTQISAT